MPIALTASLFSAVPAAAVEPELEVDSRVRMITVDYWRTGGAGVKEAAEQALMGSDQDIRM
ncbi:ALF repeat-containing protein [Streptomyces sp. NPDC047097]|uniref:ALF repeat-containing protein n=1 Tax=Streptomyces sp. NPDC047097 TaxID=3155260 RepID=UPI0033C3483A